MGLFDWFRKDKKNTPAGVERDDNGRWVEIEVVPATVSGKIDSIPEIKIEDKTKPKPKPKPKKVVAPTTKTKPVAKSAEKKEAIKKDLADTPVAKAKPKPKPKTTPKKK
jgi:hypothetical protein